MGAAYARAKKYSITWVRLSATWYYFVTITGNWRQNIFASNEKLIRSALETTIQEAPAATVDTFILRPNHVHLIIQIRNSPVPLGTIIRRFKARTSRILGTHAWQPNYYENIIRSEEALGMIREYIRRNAELEVLKMDRFYSHGR